MAPKKAAKPAQREKAVEEKTFGMKNKKGGKGQKIVQQVKQSIDASANKGGGRGPSKKEMKEQQKAQEAEMMALFNIVPKKTDDAAQVADELDADTGPTFTDITQEIEYQRANVVAKTKITDDVFQEWRRRKMAARREKEETERKDRLKRGMLTGWEIFMESATNIVDDDTAAGDDDMMREINEEEEIARMEALSLAAQRDARIAAGMDPGDDPGPSASGGAVTTATGVELSAEDQAALFDDDDEDSDVDLDALEKQVAAA